ncbi:MAG TPA: CoA-transferase [Ktedonobacterales bacterium]|jgi:glutaconate CoA-transferase subunit A
MPGNKLMSLREAVERFVPDGASVALGLALEALIPFAAGHEIIRQRRCDLTLIGPISDMLFDQMIGAGCVRKVQAAWVGNVSEGLAHNYRRAAEQSIPHPLIIEEHSNFSIALSLLAAGLGAPYLPTRTLLGSDIPRQNPTFRQGTDPWTNEPLLLVPAIRPDIAILQVQRADSEGNAHVWGCLGICEEAAMAAQGIILVAEEIVSPETIFSDPNRVLTPAVKALAVVHEPGGAHPAPVQGYYNRDHGAFREYHTRTRSLEGFEQWLAEWVTGIANRQEYLAHLGAERWQSLAVKEHRYAAPTDYGY